MRTGFSRISRWVLLVSAVIAGTWNVSHAQEAKSKIPAYLSISGFIDGQYSYELQENNAVTPAIKDETSTFQLRRARLDFKGGVTDKIDFRIQAEVAGTPKMLDAFIKLKLNKAFNIEAGQFKTPFTLENQYGPLTQEAIENSIVINKLAGFSDVLGGKRSGGRDIGLMLYGTLFESADGSFPVLSYNLGVFNGNGINTKDDNNSKDIIARIDFHPFIKEVVLSASAMKGTYDNGAEKNARNNRYSFGGEFKNDALTVRSEYVCADIQEVGATTKYEGFYVVADYWFNLGESAKMSPVLRYDYYNATGVPQKLKQTNYLFGLDFWPQSHLRFQVNYTLIDRAKYDKPGHLLQTLLTVKF